MSREAARGQGTGGRGQGAEVRSPRTEVRKTNRIRDTGDRGQRPKSEVRWRRVRPARAGGGDADADSAASCPSTDQAMHRIADAPTNDQRPTASREKGLRPRGDEESRSFGQQELEPA